MAEVLAESKHLTHIDIKDNDIRVAGLMALQLAHRMNYVLLSMQTPKAFKVEQVGWLYPYLCVVNTLCSLTSEIGH